MINMALGSIITCVGVFLYVTGVIADDAINCYRRNEVLKCVTDCPPEKTCKTKDVQFNCLQSDEGCKQKCVCEDGYFRNPLGDCISRENCDRCNGEHEYFSCGGACDNVCSQLNEQNQTNCPIVNIVCNNMCYCEENYARDDNNRCIPIKDCKKSKSKRDVEAVNKNGNKCGPNEEYQKCKETCPPDDCFSLVARFDCSNEPPCMPGCRCQPGYLRNNSTSPCVPICECPQMANSPDCN